MFIFSYERKKSQINK